MLVTDIEISQYRFCTESSRHLANVSMTLKHRIVTMFCRLDLPENENTNNRATAFVVEATRQLLRMPEYRSGREQLAFSDTLGGFSGRQSA